MSLADKHVVKILWRKLYFVLSIGFAKRAIADIRTGNLMLTGGYWSYLVVSRLVFYNQFSFNIVQVQWRNFQEHDFIKHFKVLVSMRFYSSVNVFAFANVDNLVVLEQDVHAAV